MSVFKNTIFTCVTLMAFAAPVQAQSTASSLTKAELSSVTRSCISKWDKPACLKSISQSTLSMASEYHDALTAAGKATEAENLKQHCAAATAATQQDFPAYAMKSAFTECANIISDIVEQTQMMPDANRYQLLYGSVSCMSADASCPAIESGLSAYK